ncbi:hypothetical protein ACQPZX_14265 [Actinoplanes sp. CA-142083]|uniref:hypothetical protein n=1 Tax=Actinoplanes sp. CA-142083 TaxID=3239903 RepID=UPI003D90403B
MNEGGFEASRRTIIGGRAGGAGFGIRGTASAGRIPEDVQQPLNVQAFVVQDCKHFVAEEQPARLLATLIPFLSS